MNFHKDQTPHSGDPAGAPSPWHPSQHWKFDLLWLDLFSTGNRTHPMQCKQCCARGSRKVFNSSLKKKKNFSWKCRKSEWKWKLLSCVQFFVTVVHGILQARILEWVAFPFSRGSSQSRDRTQVSHIAGGFFKSWATRKIQEYWSG